MVARRRHSSPIGRLLRLIDKAFRDEPAETSPTADQDATRRREGDERRHGENIAWQARSYRALVIIGVLTIVATIAAAWITGLPSREPSTPTGDEPNLDAADDPSATESPPSGEFVDLHPVDFPAWYTPARTEQLGTPPKFELDGEVGEFHCKEWSSWFRTVPAAPLIGETYVVVKAPSSTAVVVTQIDIELHEYHRWRSEGTIIQCGYGGDIFSASTASFSFADSTVRLVGENGEGTIPPDQYRVPAGLAEVIGFAPQGQPGFYEWSMTIHAIIDQKEVVQAVGSKERPLYAFVEPEPDVFEILPKVDWDIAACEWASADYSLVDPTNQREWSCG